VRPPPPPSTHQTEREIKYDRSQTLKRYLSRPTRIERGRAKTERERENGESKW
jgi:hypothetical protein